MIRRQQLPDREMLAIATNETGTPESDGQKATPDLSVIPPQIVLLRTARSITKRAGHTHLQRPVAENTELPASLFSDEMP